MLMNMPSRNDTLGFARRTLNNLVFIEAAQSSDNNAEVHAVTQLVLSLLGILVFPFTKLDKLQKPIFSKTISEARDEGWLGWHITKDDEKNKTTETVRDLVRHLRNAVSHARIRFGTDSRNPSEEILTFEDGHEGDTNWRAEITGDELRRFCMGFLQLVNSEMN
jgi:HEPN pEK499 p136